MNIKGWYIPGYGGDVLIAIKVKSVEEEPGGFIWVDEPIGHGITIDELFTTREEAENELRHRIETAKEYDEKIIAVSLTECRESMVKFIKSTWKRAGINIDLENDYRDKEEDLEWFGPQHIEEA